MQCISYRTLRSFIAVSFTCFALFLLARRLSPVMEAQTQEPATGATRQAQYPSEIHLEFHTSPEEAAKALASVNGLLNFSSEHSGLPIRARVQGQLINRAGVKQKIDANLRKEDVAVRLDRSSLVLKKLGLVPRDFDIRAFILGVQKDDTLAGFYDPATKEFYMLDWVPPKDQLPVMAHELTHALQDQYIGLEKWIKPTGNTEEEPVGAKGRDEPEMARRAVAEGQAMAVMMDYVLAPSARTLTDLPALEESTIQKAMLRATRPAFLRAPRYIRESETFPYTYGLRFVYQVLKKDGKGRAFAGTLRSPPLNSRQVMHPAAYLAGESTPPFNLPPLKPIVGSNYEMLDAGTLGEFDVMMFAEQFGLEEKAPEISAQWRGGYYFAVQRKNAGTGSESGPPTAAPSSVAEKLPTGLGTGEHPGVVALFYISRWASPAAATQFAHLYASSVLQRYSGATPRSKPPKAGQPPATTTDWDTPEGLVSVEARGPLVLVLESFDDSTTSRLRSTVIEREPSKSLHVSSAR